MKLAERDPQWVVGRSRETGQDRPGTGLLFRCPHCTRMVRVFFTNPMDGGKPVLAGIIGGPSRLYTRDGTELETLTLLEVLELREHGRWTLRKGVFAPAGEETVEGAAPEGAAPLAPHDGAGAAPLATRAEDRAVPKGDAPADGRAAP